MYYIILIVLTAIMIVLGAKTNLLRDIVDQGNFAIKAAAANNKNPQRPFSWARTQLAFWTVVISSSFFYLLFKYDFSIPELNNVNLILLGVAVGTTASAKLIDDSQKSRTDLSQDYPSEGFLRDILSDKNGVTIHRLQNVIWTVIVGIIYIQCVGSSKVLPDETVLTNNLLILMGISTTAYLGIKTTENAGK